MREVRWRGWAESEAEANVVHRSKISATMRPLLLIALLIPVPTQAQTARGTNPLAADVERLSSELNPQVVAWRRDFHQNPELGNRETRTARVIADELRKLGFAVTTGLATTGVVGVLKGGLPGPSSRSAPTWMRCQ